MTDEFSSIILDTAYSMGPNNGRRNQNHIFYRTIARFFVANFPFYLRFGFEFFAANKVKW